MTPYDSSANVFHADSRFARIDYYFIISRRRPFFCRSGLGSESATARKSLAPLRRNRHETTPSVVSKMAAVGHGNRKRRRQEAARPRITLVCLPTKKPDLSSARYHATMHAYPLPFKKKKLISEIVRHVLVSYTRLYPR